MVVRAIDDGQSRRSDTADPSMYRGRERVIGITGIDETGAA
jgi:hypothetical protein